MTDMTPQPETIIHTFQPLSKSDVARALGVCVRTVESWVNAGEIPPPAKIGARVYWHPRTFYAWLDNEFSMARHLPALIVRHALAQRRSNRPQLGRKASQGRGGRGIGIWTSNSRRLELSTSTPTADLLPAPLMRSPSQCPGIKRSSISGGRTWMLTLSGIWPRRSLPLERGRRFAWPWRRQANQLPSQLAPGVGVDGGVDGLVGDVEFGAVWVHPTQCASNLLGRILPGQQGGDHAPEDAIPVQFGRRACGIASRRRGLLRCAGCIDRRLSRIAAQLAQDGRGRAPQCSGHGPNTAPLLHQTGYRHAPFGLKLSVRRRSFHRNTLQVWGVALQI